jgi:hypothetical protein
MRTPNAAKNEQGRNTFTETPEKILEKRFPELRVFQLRESKFGIRDSKFGSAL